MIRVGEYGLRADTESWVFGKIGLRKVKDTESDEMEEYITNPVYPTSLDSALKRYAEVTVRDADPHSWAEVVVALKRVREELARISDILTEVRA